MIWSAVCCRKSEIRLGRIRTACLPLAGDGSQRAFFRLRFADETALVAVLPAGRDLAQMAEARSAWLIGTHLSRAGVPVPAPLAFDEESGLILFEDLGDLRLHDLSAEG